MTDKPASETLYIPIHEGRELGIGTLEELVALADDGILPPREELTFALVGTYRLAA
jgi:hypothetical protein